MRDAIEAPAVAGAPAWTVTHTAPAATATPCGLSPRRIVAAMRAVPGSMRVTVPARRLVTHSAPAPSATAAGPPPTRTTSAIALVAGSMRLTRSSSGTATQTPPAPAASARALSRPGSWRARRRSPGRCARRCRRCRRTPTRRPPPPPRRSANCRAGSARRSAGAPGRAAPCRARVETQTAPGVTATGRGSSGPPRSIRYVRATVRKAGSITRASPRSASATQTPLGPAPSPSRSMPGESVPMTRRERAPIRVTVSSPWFPTHTDPPATARSAGRPPTGTWATTRPSLGSSKATWFGITSTASAPRVAKRTAAATAAIVSSPAAMSGRPERGLRWRGGARVGRVPPGARPRRGAGARGSP